MPTTERRDTRNEMSAERDELQRQTRLTADEIETLVADYVNGVSVPDVAAKYHIHRTTALRHLERAGIPRRPTRPSLTADQLAEALNRRACGESYATIAKLFAVHPETIRRTLTKQPTPPT